MIELMRRPTIIENGTVYTPCPVCQKSVPVITSGIGSSVTIKVECKKCKRKVVKNGERKKYNDIKYNLMATWNGSLHPSMDDDL